MLDDIFEKIPPPTNWKAGEFAGGGGFCHFLNREEPVQQFQEGFDEIFNKQLC